MTQTRKMAYVAILGSISFLLMFFSFAIPFGGVTFLKVEFSIIPILIGLVIMDTPGAICVLVMRSLLKLLLNNTGVETYIGLPMNMLMVLTFILAFAWIWKKQQTKVRFILAGTIGTIGATLLMLALNLFYAIPLYATFANFDIAKVFGVGSYLATAVLPFNLLQGVLYVGAFAMILGVMQPVLKRYEK